MERAVGDLSGIRWCRWYYVLLWPVLRGYCFIQLRHSIGAIFSIPMLDAMCQSDKLLVRFGAARRLSPQLGPYPMLLEGCGRCFFGRWTRWLSNKRERSM